jgi:hypothetical protein
MRVIQVNLSQVIFKVFRDLKDMAGAGMVLSRSKLVDNLRITPHRGC